MSLLENEIDFELAVVFWFKKFNIESFIFENIIELKGHEAANVKA